jgi:hypothetical protein
MFRWTIAMVMVAVAGCGDHEPMAGSTGDDRGHDEADETPTDSDRLIEAWDQHELGGPEGELSCSQSCKCDHHGCKEKVACTGDRAGCSCEWKRDCHEDHCHYTTTCRCDESWSASCQ